tara:strand:- start:6343 stop:7065 length:723 start_codon:yes stop_codon:yes gene_type:complete
MNKMLLLALGLIPLLSTTVQANDRYRERPPVIVSPDLTAPWLMQLGGGGVRPVVYPSRPAEPRPFFRERSRSTVQPAAVRPNQVARHQIEPQFLPQTVAYDTKHAPGTIIIDTNNRFLYLVTGKGQARRYGVGVGKPGFEWAGMHKVSRKAEWPRWTPPKEMVAREAAKGHYLPASMDGGPANPLGARALYLGSTLYRIHGTNAPWSIGSAVSSGCIRMRNEDVVDLYERVKVGTKVIVI